MKVTSTANEVNRLRLKLFSSGRLTDKQEQVLLLAIEGYTIKEIASIANIPTSTVYKAHDAAISKLGVDDIQGARSLLRSKPAAVDMTNLAEERALRISAVHDLRLSIAKLQEIYFALSSLNTPETINVDS